MSNPIALRDALAGPSPVVLPVIHVRDVALTLANVEIAVGEGAQGVFLINHDFGVEPFLPIIEAVRRGFPNLRLGVNFLGVGLEAAAPVLADLGARGVGVDAYWADDARLDERVAEQPAAAAAAAARAASGWRGLYFGGVAFKKQRPVAPERYPAAARLARDWVDVATTSGPATGQAADEGKIATFRAALGDHPLAIASGVTPENAARYAAADAFLVATGINIAGDFHRIHPARLAALLREARRLGGEQG